MKKDQPLNLNRLIFASVISFPFSSINAKQETIFPDQIGEYKFTKRLRIAKRNSKGNKMFSYAIYRNSSGKKAFAKMWSGIVKDFNYYTLHNEAVLYQTLNKVIRKIGKSMPKKFNNINIPQVINKQESKNSLILLVEFVEGVQASKLRTEKQFEIYLKVVDFLNLLGDKLSEKEKEQIAKRDAKIIVLLYFPLLLKSIFTHPKAIFSLLCGIPVFLRAIPPLLKANELSLNHRDLHLENILISKNKISLVDMQYCLFSNSLCDIVTSLKLHWSDTIFCQRLFDEIRNRYGENKDFDILIKGLMVNTATHSLTGSNFTKPFIKKFINYLNFALQPKLGLRN